MSGALPGRVSYAECSARERIARLFDAGTFREWLPPAMRVMSPHLAQLGVPDDTAIAQVLDSSAVAR